MKIEFDESQESFQKAMLFKQLIEYARSHALVDRVHLDVVADIHKDLEQFLSQEQFQVYRADDVLSHSFDNISKPGLIREFIQSITALFGPSRLERELSEQRRVLMERAERAEAMSYETLAEMADVGRQRDDALEKLAALEKVSGQSGESDD